MAPLAGRRLAEMVELGAMLAAMELVVAAQAVDLRSGAVLGEGTRDALSAGESDCPGARGRTADPRQHRRG